MRRLVVMAFVALVLGGCSSCRGRDDEKEIRDLIERAARMAEKHDVGGLMKLTTRRFEADPGAHDRDGTRSVLMYAFHRYGSFVIMYARPSVEIDPSGLDASARVPFIVVREGRPIPDLGRLYESPEQWVEEAGRSTDPYNLELWLQKLDGEWKVDRARIEGLRGLEGL